MKKALAASVVTAAIFARVAVGVGTDPRICAMNNQAQCGRAAAALALRTHMRNTDYALWNAQIVCRGYAGLLRYRCTWPGGHTATVTFALSNGRWNPAVVVTSAKWPGLIGNPAAGIVIFNATCSMCHSLGAELPGGGIGPGLGTVGPTLTEAAIINTITYGAAGMSPDALSGYTTKMAAFGDSLTATQINNVAAYIYTSTHKSTG